MILNSPNIIRTVRKRWLIGESAKGGLIGEYQSGEYRAFKIGLNPSASGTVDLTLTGALGAGLIVKTINSTTFEVLSTDEKYEKIGGKYGFDEFGLSESEWLEISDEILAFALETIIKRTYE